MSCLLGRREVVAVRRSPPTGWSREDGRGTALSPGDPRQERNERVERRGGLGTLTMQKQGAQCLCQVPRGERGGGRRSLAVPKLRPRPAAGAAVRTGRRRHGLGRRKGGGRLPRRGCSRRASAGQRRLARAAEPRPGQSGKRARLGARPRAARAGGRDPDRRPRRASPPKAATSWEKHFPASPLSG